MGKYELLYIVHPDLESSIDKITGHVKDSISKREGKVTYEENWGKRKLAYPIKKSDTGIYVLVYFELPKENFEKIERELRLTEEIIRFMALAKEEKVGTKAVKAPAKKAAPREEAEKEILVKVEKKNPEPEKIGEKTEAEPEKKKASKKPATKKPVVKKPAPKKEEKKPASRLSQGGEAEESEEERMKKLDEKLGEILGKE